MSGMTNRGELPVNTVRHEEPKVLTGSGQNGKQRECGLYTLIPWIIALPVKRKGLTHSDIYSEHGKPVFLPKGKADRKVCR